MDLSRILPLRRSRSPVCLLLRTPVTIVKHTSASSDSPGLHHRPDYLPYNCLFPLVLSLGVIDSVFMSVSHSWFVVLFYEYLLNPCFPTPSVHIKGFDRFNTFPPPKQQLCWCRLKQISLISSYLENLLNQILHCLQKVFTPLDIFHMLLLQPKFKMD